MNKILVANRGEIAVRIIKSIHAMGIKSVAVYSDVDRAAPHVELADEAVYLGAAPASESYLSIDKVIKAAKDNSKLVSIDPNIRPTLITDMQDYTARLASAFSYADIIKASDEDCALLFGHADIETLRADHFAAARLIVITLGSKGIMAQTSSGQPLEMPVEKLANIRDTVGAGDCFQAGLLSQLWQNGYLQSTSALDTLDAEKLSPALAFGHKVAAINCQRDGCNPPFLHEVGNS